jgi:hypothetical protein
MVRQITEKSNGENNDFWINSFPVMAVNKRPLFGLYYSEGHILTKNWTKRVLLRHHTNSFKDARLFIK